MTETDTDIIDTWQQELDAAAWRTRAAASTRERDELQEALRQSDEARRNRPKVYTLAFRFRSREDFEKARAAADAGGDRVRWLLSKVDKDGG